MPNTAIAVARPAGGSAKLNPDATSAGGHRARRRSRTAAANTVITREERDLEDGEALDARVAAPKQDGERDRQADGDPRLTPMAGTTVWSTCATPPYIPPTCSSVSVTVIAHAHTTQLAPAAGRARALKPSSPVCPVTIV